MARQCSEACGVCLDNDPAAEVPYFDTGVLVPGEVVAGVSLAPACAISLCPRIGRGQRRGPEHFRGWFR